MSHFRPTSRGEDLGEHLDVFRPLPCSGGSLPQKNSKLGGASPKVSIPYRKFLKNEPLQANFKGRGPGRAPGCLQASGKLLQCGKLSWGGVLQVSQVRRQMVGTCGKSFMWQAIVDFFKSGRPGKSRFRPEASYPNFYIEMYLFLHKKRQELDNGQCVFTHWHVLLRELEHGSHGCPTLSVEARLLCYFARFGGG